MKKKVGIYKITSPSGRVYIGQSWNIKLRWLTHGHNFHSAKLCASFNKYGKGLHEFAVIHELPFDINQETLDRYEQIYIDAYRGCGIDLLNLREAGSVGRMSIESREKMSKSRMGRIVSNETRKKISDAHKGKKKPKSREHIEKVRALLKGKKRSPEMIEKAANKRRGKKRTPEQIKRISEAHKGQPAWNKGIPMSEEQKQMLSQSRLGKKLSCESVIKREATKRLRGNSGWLGKTIPIEARMKMSNAKKKPT